MLVHRELKGCHRSVLKFIFLIIVNMLQPVATLRCNYCTDLESKCRDTYYEIDCKEFNPCSFASEYKTFKKYYPANVSVLAFMFAHDRRFDLSSVRDKIQNDEELSDEELNNIPRKKNCSPDKPKVCIKEHFYTGKFHKTRKGCGIKGQMNHCKDNRYDQIWECYECARNLCNSANDPCVISAIWLPTILLNIFCKKLYYLGQYN